MARAIQTESDKDTIVAPATPAGVGAIAIVRLTGPESMNACSRVFSHDPSRMEPGRLVLGTLKHPGSGESLDQCLAVAWRAPSSFTGEDMMEFHIHGSPAIVQAALDACLSAGARHATPGEFTRRAYLNGKVDLAQAEAVSDLTQSQTEDARRAALSQLSGGLSQLLMKIRGDLIQVTAELEASVDYPDEEIPDVSRERLGGLVDRSQRRIQELVASYERGRRLHQGARIVFAGPPNAGKSSLFNAILRRERAIVTPHPGTTRDSLEAVVELRGIPVTLIDTAGLRLEAEEIEAIGIERTRQEIESADLVLFVVDCSEPTAEAEREYEAIRPLAHLLVFNKADAEPDETRRRELIQRFSGKGQAAHLFASVKERHGIGLVEEKAIDILGLRQSEGGSPAVITSARHEAALKKAADSLQVASEGLATGLSPEFIVVDLSGTLSEMDAILGRQELDEEILDAVFSTFCLGK